jgi:hypothetical protein
MIPLRLCFTGLVVGATSLYYLSRNHEINRVKNLKFSFDMIFQVGWRSVVAAIVGDVVSRKLFVNYQKITENKISKNEIKKAMRTFPNARPMLGPHQKPNSYYYAM